MHKSLLLLLVVFAGVFQWGCTNKKAPVLFDDTLVESERPLESSKINHNVDSEPSNTNTVETKDTESLDSETVEEKKSRLKRDAKRKHYLERKTSSYRIRTNHSKSKLQQLWNQSKRNKICIHGRGYLSDEKNYESVKKLIYNIDDGIIDFLATKLTSKKATRVHTSAGVSDDAPEYGLAWALLRERTRSNIFDYDGDDPEIIQLMGEWQREVEAGDSDLGYVFLEIQEKIVSNKKSREALVKYFSNKEKESPIKKAEAGFGEGVIPYSKFAGKAKRLKKIKVELPVLENNNESSCPISKEDLFVELDFYESKLEELKFVRTARIGSDKYWLWERVDDELQTVILVFQLATGEFFVTYQENEDGWTPEQYILGNYYGMTSFWLGE